MEKKRETTIWRIRDAVKKEIIVVIALEQLLEAKEASNHLRFFAPKESVLIKFITWDY